MSLLTGSKEDDISALLRKQNIDGQYTFVVARRHNSVVKGLLKLVASNLYNAMDATTLRFIVATPSEFVVINPNLHFGGSYEDLPEDRITRLPWEQVQHVSVDQRSRAADITWVAAGKEETWTVDTANPGVWHFNPAHLKKLHQSLL